MTCLRAMADRLNSARDSRDVWMSSLQVLSDLGLSKVVFFDLSKATAPVILSNAGADWTDEYTATVLAGRDPFPLNCLSRVDPVLTGIGHMEGQDYLSDAALEQVAQGSESLNIRTGLSITLCPDQTGAGIGLNLMSNHSVAEFSQLRAEQEAVWRAWCQLTYAGLSKQPAPLPVAILSVRESDCLALVADGLRTNEIAYRLGISDGTVEMHTRNARAKLGAKTRDQAVAIAVRSGLV